MPQQEVISPVTARTEWCAGIVPVRKPNDSVRICVDLTQPNKAAQREIHPISLLDENFAKLGDGKRFYKLDANSGFWQIPLDAKSKLLMHNLCHTIWMFLFHQTPIWYQLLYRDLPT